MENYNLYKDIAERTNGEIYIGVVGPVRTGKSTFIKRFMDILVLPEMKDEAAKERTRDELPQSAAGKMIMTTEPKFIPKDAAVIPLPDKSEVQIRLIDCVGYMTNGATGHIENETERMVKTPWFENEIPFTKAAEIGTYKVINEHSSIGFVVTTDGSFGEIERENYEKPEEETIRQLKKIGKPFVVLLNSSKPYSEETKNLAKQIETKNNVTVFPVNCQQLKKDDILNILTTILNEFPVSRTEFYMPKWVEMLSSEHWLKKEIIQNIKDIMPKLKCMRDVTSEVFENACKYVKNYKLEEKNLSDGVVKVIINIVEDYYYQVLSELTGTDIPDEYRLITCLKEFSGLKDSYAKVKNAMEEVRMRGYGVVTPERKEITLAEPEIIKTGNKYGVKIKAEAPSVHMIKANILTEIAPIVGSEQQAKDLIEFINENSKSKEDGIWETNIFGKSIEQIVEDGINTKISRLSDETQEKLQNTLQKITNESNGGVICIII